MLPFCRNARLPLDVTTADVDLEKEVDEISYIRALRDRLSYIQSNAYFHIKRDHTANLNKHPSITDVRKYAVGDTVWLLAKPTKKHNRFAFRWNGPYIVARTDSTRPLVYVIRTLRGHREYVVSVRRLKLYYDLPSRLLPCPDELPSPTENSPSSQTDVDTYMHADPACVTRESLELLPASEWEVCTCKNSLHVRDILRLLYHGGSTVSDASRFYYARIDYMNRQRSWMRMTCVVTLLR